MKIRVHIVISGLVQGVFFRHNIRKKAERFGVYGWVRNLSDGKVEALFEGNRENIEKVIEFCKRGPPGAEVTSVEINHYDWKGEFQEFSIRH